MTVIESDSLLLVQEPYSNNSSVLIGNCYNLLQELLDCVLRFVRKKGNMVAHVFARATGEEGRCGLWQNCPTFYVMHGALIFVNETPLFFQ